MKKIMNLLVRLRGLTTAVIRYPLTVLFLLIATVTIAISINTGVGYVRAYLACAVGVFLSASLQAVYERFFQKISMRIILIGCGGIATGIFYLVLMQLPELNVEISVRTSVVILMLIVVYIWGPVIRSRMSFNESFLVAFKAFFHTILYAGVIFAGSTLIIAAVDTLIVNVSEKAYMHTANIVFVLFSPLFFLSLIPVYPGKEDAAKEDTAKEAKTKEDMDKKTDNSIEADKQLLTAIACPRFLEVLIAYIIIPLTSVFTVILVLYIALNIRGEFWTNNLLEPMLVSYSITVILVYILASRLENETAVLFRKIFPKVLVPIVLFQIVSSALNLGRSGITYSRYFVIVFGLFAVCAGLVMSIANVKKNGIIAAIFLGFAAFSIIPPVDAFTISRFSQEKLLENVLTKNGMLENDKIKADKTISDEDKETIVSTISYLEDMGYMKAISWMPEGFKMYEDFYDTFGFHEYEVIRKTDRTINVFRNAMIPVEIEGYDFMIQSYISTDDEKHMNICSITNNGKTYTITKTREDTDCVINVQDEKNNTLINFDTKEIFERYLGYSLEKGEISNEEARFTIQNSQIKMTFLVQSAGMNVTFNQGYRYADFYILLQFK